MEKLHAIRRGRNKEQLAADPAFGGPLEKKQGAEKSAVEVGAVAQIEAQSPNALSQRLFSKLAYRQAGGHLAPAYHLKCEGLLLLMEADHAMWGCHASP